MASYALGIDLGTTYTAAALWRDGRAETVPLGERAASIPSALFLRADGVMLVGEAADRRGTTEPDRIARHFKRRLGDDAPLLLGEAERSAPELTGYLLRWVVDRVTEREGAPPAHTTLACPASWGPYRRRLMTEAAATAGLSDVGLVEEPVAAAAYYASLERLPAGTLVAVYDLGGGTFDATVLRKTAAGFELCGAPGGDESIGGTDFDQVVLDHVAAALGTRWRLLDTADPVVLAGLAQVRAHAVAAKEALSADVEASIPVILPDVTRDVRITRGEFETGIRIPVLRTVDSLAQTVAAAGVEVADLHAVLLVGGSSRIPLVSRLLAEEFGAPVAVDAHPKYAVCLGAAISAAPRLAPAAPTAPAPAAPRAAAPGLSPESAPAREPADAAPARPPAPDTSGADLLAPDPAGPALAVDLADAGLAEPADVLLRPVPDPARVLPPLTAVDEPLTVVHTGDVRRGWRSAVLVAAAAALLLAAVSTVAALADRPRGQAGGTPTITTPPTTAPSPAGPATVLRAQPVPGRPGELIRAVAGAAGVLVGVGESTELTEPRVWLRRSGRWTQGFGPTGTMLRGAMTGIAAGTGTGARYVAVGWAAPAGAAARDRRAAIWTSADGRSWARVPAANLGATPDPAGSRSVGALLDVTARPGGGFLATGVDWRTDPDAGDGVLLASADGTRWRQVPSRGLDGPGPTELRRVLAGPGAGAVAVGTRLRGTVSRSVLWASTDGTGWTEAAGLDTAAGEAASAWALARGADGALLALGSAAAVDGSAVPLLWSGPTPGQVRLRAVTGAGAAVYGLHVAGPAVTAVGARRTAAGTAPAAWTVQLAGSAG